VDIDRIRKGEGKVERFKSVNGDGVRSSGGGENRGDKEEDGVISISRLYLTYPRIRILGDNR
jgi:hypothetical protein